MNALREQIQRDIESAFFNSEEFAEMHKVNGKDMLVVVDGGGLERIKERAGYADNIYSARHALFVRADEFGAKPAAEALFDFDGRRYRVISASGELVYKIILGETRG